MRNEWQDRVDFELASVAQVERLIHLATEPELGEPDYWLEDLQRYVTDSYGCIDPIAPRGPPRGRRPRPKKAA